MLALVQLPRAVATAYDKRAPNHLCEFAYTVAQNFSQFYNQCHILRESDAGRRASWLALSTLCLQTMERVLDLLGIQVPARM
jgi:arginyl-tRNA synthetase